MDLFVKIIVMCVGLPIFVVKEYFKRQFGKAKVELSSAIEQHMAPKDIESPSGSSFTAMPEPSFMLTPLADQHITVMFNDNFAATLSVFNNERRVKRRLRPTSAAAEAMMKDIWSARSWAMHDIELVDGITVDDCVLFTEEQGCAILEDLLAAKGPKFLSQIQKMQAKYAGGMPPAPIHVTQASMEKAVAVLANNSTSAAAVIAPTGVIAEPVKPSVVVVDKRTITEIEGYVIEAGMRQMNFGNNGPGDTFEVTIESKEAGETASFRGVRLQELFTQHDICVGDLISLKSLGKTSVNGTNKQRNEFEVKLLERAAIRA